jgi:hypothetical protein
MGNRPFSFAAAVSLLLLFATAVLWLRSYWIGDVWQVQRVIRHQKPAAADDEYEYVRLAVGGGYCAIEHHRLPAGHALTVQRLFHVSASLPPGTTSLLSDQMAGIENPPFSLAGPALLFAILPGFWLALRSFRPPPNTTTCRRCGYNLTGNTSGTCPECGTSIP